MLSSFTRIASIKKSLVLVNSSWGIISQVLQNVLLSLFFILIARFYSTQVFASFLIAMVLYQLISAFSTLGLSQWFIREITGTSDKKELINRFFKIQLYAGILFYILTIVVGYFLYEHTQAFTLIVILGINIIFDNLINAIKCINISEFKQKKTFAILSLESFLKFATTCLLFVLPFSVITLSLILIIIRLLTLNLFLNIGSSNLIDLNSILRNKVNTGYIKQLLRANWPFIIIGSVSIVNWRVSTIIISKVLNSLDVANFEISYRVFSIAQMLPVAVSTTVFPILIKYFKDNEITGLSGFYKKVHYYYFLFGVLSFTFIYSFSDTLLPLVFGSTYADAGYPTKLMFLTILVFPTVFLKANVLVAMKCERLDMNFNIICLITNLTCCIVGIYLIRSLSVIIISIFIGFLVFHVLQDIALIKRKICSKKHAIGFYVSTLFLVACYFLLAKLLDPLFLFIGFWMILFAMFLIYRKLIRIEILKNNYKLS